MTTQTKWQKEPPGEGWYYHRRKQDRTTAVPRKLALVNKHCCECGTETTALRVVSDEDWPYAEHYGGEWYPQQLPGPPR